jgi:hypothetical protein
MIKSVTNHHLHHHRFSRSLIRYDREKRVMSQGEKNHMVKLAISVVYCGGEHAALHAISRNMSQKYHTASAWQDKLCRLFLFSAPKLINTRRLGLKTKISEAFSEIVPFVAPSSLWTDEWERKVIGLKEFVNEIPLRHNIERNSET